MIDELFLKTTLEQRDCNCWSLVNNVFLIDQ